MPFLVEVEDLVVGVLEIRSGTSVRTVTGIRLAGSMHDTHLELRRLQGGLDGLELRADGSVRFEPGLPVDAKVEWRLTEPALSGAGTLRGNLTALEVMQIVHLPETVAVLRHALRSGGRTTGQGHGDLGRRAARGARHRRR